MKHKTELTGSHVPLFHNWLETYWISTPVSLKVQPTHLAHLQHQPADTWGNTRHKASRQPSFMYNSAHFWENKCCFHLSWWKGKTDFYTWQSHSSSLSEQAGIFPVDNQPKGNFIQALPGMFVRELGCKSSEMRQCPGPGQSNKGELSH